MNYVDHLWEHGYAIIKDVYEPADIEEISAEMDRLKEQTISRYHSTFRDKNTVFVVRPHPSLGRHVRFIHWPSYFSPILAKYRIDARQLDVVGPVLGQNLKQIANQATWKTPASADTVFGFHQDARFRRPASAFRHLHRSYLQTFIAIDPHRQENGCLKVYPASHKLGILDLPVDRSVLDQDHDGKILQKFGLDPQKVVNVVLDPGDMVIWLPHTLHASGPNLSDGDRRSYVNGYVIAENCDRGEWAFKNGQPCELGEPVLVQYDDLYTRPEPHYVSGALYPKK